MQQISILFFTLTIGGIFLFGWILLIQKKYSKSLLTEQEKTWMDLLVWEKNITLEHIGNELHDHVKQLVLLERRLLENLIKKQEELTTSIAPIVSLNLNLEQSIDQLTRTSYQDNIDGKNLITLLEEFKLYVTMAYKIELMLINKEMYMPRTAPYEEVMLYRVFQELIQNTQKHTSANKIILNFERKNNRQQITFQDNGSKKQETSPHLLEVEGKGLNSIKTRIQLLHGSYSLELLPTTLFVLHLPYSETSDH